MDKYNIDNHKLQFHVERVYNWQKGHIIYPIYIEMSPSGVCNHNCNFCAFDYVESEKSFLDTKTAKNIFNEMGFLGIKSILFSGEGEPLLHKDIIELVECAKKSGIDMAMATNGVLLDKNKAEKILPNLEWIKISIDAGTPDTYAKVHGTNQEDFEKMLLNLENAVELKKKHDYKAVIGTQFLLLPENYNELIVLAERLSGIGVDYLVIKPYSQHQKSINKQYKDINYEEFYHLKSELEKFNSKEFKIIFRINTMSKWDKKERGFKTCHAMNFWAHIDVCGNVWACSSYLGDERFNLGSIKEKSFKDIWTGKKRQEFLKWVSDEMCVSDCRVNCRMDEINNYLWKIKNPPAHVNFI